MWRTRIVSGLCLAGLLGLVGWCSPATHADPIVQMTGEFREVSPAGSGLEQVLFKKGIVDRFVDETGHSPALSPLDSATWGTTRSGRFPHIDVFNDAGGKTFALRSTLNPDEEALFRCPDDNTLSAVWGSPRPEGFEARIFPAFLESNTIAGLDLSRFSREAGGGVFTATSSGLTIDPTTNTATVADGATASFSLTAAPEPAAVGLAVGGGLLAFAWLWLTRRHQIGGSPTAPAAPLPPATAS